jgi:hypothetical protein
MNKPVIVRCGVCGEPVNSDYTVYHDITGHGEKIIDVCEPCLAEINAKAVNAMLNKAQGATA